jgi:hypothetical protein
MPQIYSYKDDNGSNRVQEYFQSELELSRNEILLLVGLLFLIIAMPITYIYVHKWTRYLKYVPDIVDSNQSPTTFGVIFHTFVFMMLMYLALEIPTWRSFRT